MKDNGSTARKKKNQIRKCGKKNREKERNKKWKKKNEKK